MLTNDEHFMAVAAFFKQCKEDDPENYERVCQKYPTLSSQRIQRIRRIESQVGLLGLAPSTIALHVADQFGYESAYDEEIE